MKRKQTRTEARTEAFKLIFQSNMHTEDIEGLFDYLLDSKPECITNINYIRNVVTGVLEKDSEIRELIANHLKPGWRLSRLSKVSFNILRLAVYEMKYVDDVPIKVAVNEAVELAKIYEEPGAAKFVNGVLGGVYRELSGEQSNKVNKNDTELGACDGKADKDSDSIAD